MSGVCSTRGAEGFPAGRRSPARENEGQCGGGKTGQSGSRRGGAAGGSCGYRQDAESDPEKMGVFSPVRIRRGSGRGDPGVAG
jgi:hypothetical protein